MIVEPNRLAPAAAPSPTRAAAPATQSAGIGSKVTVTAMISAVAATTPTSVIEQEDAVPSVGRRLGVERAAGRAARVERRRS